MITLLSQRLLRMQLLSTKRADPRDVLCREACDAELQQSKVTVNPGTSVSIFLPFFSSIQSWMERTLPFSMKVQLPSSSSRACNIYAACFSLICSFITMTHLTTAVYPCARGDPSWPKEDLSLGQQCGDPYEQAGRAVPTPCCYTRVITGLFPACSCSPQSPSWFFY